MTDYKIILGIFASVIGLAGYLPYFYDMVRGKTKPHVFSWLVWSLLEGIAFFAQIMSGGGPGAWVTGSSAVFCFIIAVAALFWGEKEIKIFDWLAFGGSLLGLALWLLTKNPLAAVIIITITDVLVFAPTFRKSYFKPHEETAASYIIAALRLALSLAAMDHLSLTTGLYPASLVVSNSIFVGMLYWRRQKLAVVGRGNFV